MVGGGEGWVGGAMGFGEEEAGLDTGWIVGCEYGLFCIITLQQQKRRFL